MLESFTNPKGVAVIGASPSPGKLAMQCCRTSSNTGTKATFTRSIQCQGNPWLANVSLCSRYSRPGGFGGGACAGQSRPRRPRRVRTKRYPRRGRHLGRLSRSGPRGSAIGTTIDRDSAPIWYPRGRANVLGIIDTVVGLNASFAAGMPRRGHIAFMSQSGALCTSILDMALGQGIGFSRFYSIGNKADLNEIDFLRAWSEDPETNVIVAYLEGITNGAEFMQVARQVTRRKPVVSIKSGTTSAGSRAASSHTGTLAVQKKPTTRHSSKSASCGLDRCKSCLITPKRLPASLCRKARRWPW